MFLIVGLGNPGKEYENTPHNVGFMVLDEFNKKELPGVRFFKPNTFMNNSGIAVKKEMRKLKLKPSHLIVVHDDIDIPLGQIKISQNKGSAGHKGVESIIQALGTKVFTRIRIGICPSAGKPENVESFVLKKFSKEESQILKQSIENACNTLEIILKEGVEKE